MNLLPDIKETTQTIDSFADEVIAMLDEKCICLSLGADCSVF